jgi:hypothetical protein
MTAPTTTRSAYPPVIDDLMPQAIELTKTLGGALPSRNRLMKDLHIGSDKARAVLTELGTLAERDEHLTGPHTAMVVRGSTAPRPPLTLVPDSPPEADTAPEPPAEAAPIEALPNPVPPPITEAEATVTEVATPTDEVGQPVTWPVLVLCLPAFVAIWGGWVEMGRLTGFGKVTLLPGIFDSFQLNTAITLPIGVETYAAYALFVWLSGRAIGDARRFAKWSALGSLGLGGLGQIAYHLMSAAGWDSAPWPITAAVSCIPVAVLGMGAALAHLMHK